MHTTNNEKQWWRWLLVPIASICGALIIAGLTKVFGRYSLALGGFPSDGYMQKYGLVAVVAGIFGSMIVKISYASAPSHKIKVAGIFTLLCIAFEVLNIVFAYIYALENIGGLVIGSLSSILDALAAYSEKNSNQVKPN